MLAFTVILAVILIDGLGLEWLPVQIEERWLLHSLAFALLVFSARLAFPRTLMFWTFIYAVLLAIFIELAQGLIPHQDMSVIHVAANVAGVLVGAVSAQVWRRQVAPLLISSDA